jgi:hypothetical protein
MQGVSLSYSINPGNLVFEPDNFFMQDLDDKINVRRVAPLSSKGVLDEYAIVFLEATFYGFSPAHPIFTARGRDFVTLAPSAACLIGFFSRQHQAPLVML